MTTDEPPRLHPAIAALQGGYAERLPEKLDAIEAAIAAARQDPQRPALLELAVRLAHRLRGSAGSYGLTEVGDAAGEVEDALAALASRPPPSPDSPTTHSLYAAAAAAISRARQLAQHLLANRQP